MKAVLFVCLLTLLSCQIDFLGTAKCIISKPKVREVGFKIINLVLNKEYKEILPTLFASFDELKESVVECLSSEEEDEVVLKDNALCKHWFKYTVCGAKCGPLNDACIKNCFKQYC